MTPEGRVKKAIGAWLDAEHPAAFYFKPVSNGMGKHGIPDFICCVPAVVTQAMVGKSIGLFVGIEAKTTAGVVSKHQVLRINEIIAAGGLALVVRGADGSLSAARSIIAEATGG